jgi:hypothetical protein
MMKEFYQKLQRHDQSVPDFDVAVSGFGESYPTRPGVPRKTIKDTSEKAFQRAIFHAKKIKVHLVNDITIDLCLLDYELPVVLNSKSRRQSVDLISKNNASFQIHEVKFNRSKDSPYFAASEIIKYRYIVSENHTLLDESDVHHHGHEFMHFNWKDLNNNCQMYIVANKDYWWYWRNRMSKTAFSEYFELMAIIGITCLSGENVN